MTDRHEKPNLLILEVGSTRVTVSKASTCTRSSWFQLTFWVVATDFLVVCRGKAAGL